MAKRTNRASILDNAARKTQETAATTGDLQKGIARALTQDANPKGGQSGKNENPEIKLLSKSQQDKIKEMIKDDKVSVILSKDDLAYAESTSKQAHDELYKEGGFFDAQSKFKAAQQTISAIPFNVALRAERAHPGDSLKAVALRVQYFESMTRQIVKDAQLADRNQRLAAGELSGGGDVQPEKELLGDHWVSVRSKMKRSLMAGLPPSKFTTATAFATASLTKKERKTGGQTAIGEAPKAGKEGIESAALAADLGPATSAALLGLVKKLRKTDVEADLHVAQQLMLCINNLDAYLSGTYAPEAVEDTKISKAS